jgi:hypothetical protein
LPKTTVSPKPAKPPSSTRASGRPFTYVFSPFILEAFLIPPKNIVKNATQSEQSQHVRPLDVSEQKQIIQDLAPLLDVKKVPPVDEPILQWVIQRTEKTWMKEERRTQLSI